jgi:hypothetical protein
VVSDPSEPLIFHNTSYIGLETVMGPEKPGRIIVPIMDCADTFTLMTDQQLLRNFTEHHDQWAFAELVNRHGGMVCATARRLVDGDAEDVAQAVFLLLSQKAAGLDHQRNLAAWLYETTRRYSANWVRHRRLRRLSFPCIA